MTYKEAVLKILGAALGGYVTIHLVAWFFHYIGVK